MGMNFTGADSCRVDIAQYYNGTTFDIPASTGAMTICAWFKATALGTNQRIFAKSELNSGTGSTLYCIAVTNDSGTQRLRVVLRTTGDTVLNGATTTIATGTIYFVCLWYDGTNLKSYINCVQEATTGKTGNVAIDSTFPCYIGDNPNVRLNFNGIIDDVRVYTRALSIPEMQTIYYSGGIDDIVYGLYARWRMNEKYPGTRSALSLLRELKDDRGNGFSAIAEDAGYALAFTAANGHHVDLASVNADFQLVAPFTIEAWVKPASVAAGVERFFGTYSGSGSNGVSFGRNGAKLRLTIHGLRDYDTTSNYLTAGVWTHIAVQFYNGLFNKSAEFFVDGSSVQTVIWAFGSDPGTTLSGAQIGANGNHAEYWDGSVDMVRVWKGLAVSNANQALYIYEHPKSSSNLKGYWKMDDASGTSVSDVSGYSHTGTLGGTTGVPTWEESGAWATPTYAEPISNQPT